jgi:ferredoxin-thioredoxin reductase catalytic subunit
MSPKNETVESYYAVLKKFAAKKGLIFNPDEKGIVLPLLEGLFANKQRYGFPSCPCRLAQGNITDDRDIVCPCQYAPSDIEEFGKCYCGLYVSDNYPVGRDPDFLVPERRQDFF